MNIFRKPQLLSSAIDAIIRSMDEKPEEWNIGDSCASRRNVRISFRDYIYIYDYGLKMSKLDKSELDRAIQLLCNRKIIENLNKGA
jgi:hypothetical protein